MRLFSWLVCRRLGGLLSRRVGRLMIILSLLVIVSIRLRLVGLCCRWIWGLVLRVVMRMICLMFRFWVRMMWTLLLLLRTFGSFCLIGWVILIMRWRGFLIVMVILRASVVLRGRR